MDDRDRETLRKIEGHAANLARLKAQGSIPDMILWALLLLILWRVW